MLLINMLKDQTNMSDTEITIANYVLAYPRDVTSESIDRLSEVLYASPASIVRFCKKLGFKGFTDFKIKLASQMSSFDLYDERIGIDMPILPGSDTESITKSFFNLSVQTLTDTFNHIDRDAMTKAAELLRTADQINILGVGPSLMIAGDLHYRMKRLGYNSTCDPLRGFHHIFKKRGVRKEVAIIISSYANSHQIKKWMIELNSQRTPVILVTANKNSPFAKMTHVTVAMDLNESRVGKMGAFASRIALTYAVDCIYAILFNLDYVENVKALYEDSLRTNYEGDALHPESREVI